MKKNVIKYGLFAAVFPTGWIILSLNFFNSPAWQEYGMFTGYASMLLGFSLIFAAVKHYRDQENNGQLSFGKGFRIGLYITLIASTIYVISWLIQFNYIASDYLDHYSAKQLAEMKANGASAAEIAKEAADNASFSELYKNNVFVRIGFTYLEIVPVGLLVSLIAAAILKKKS